MTTHPTDPIEPFDISRVPAPDEPLDEEVTIVMPADADPIDLGKLQSNVKRRDYRRALALAAVCLEQPGTPLHEAVWEALTQHPLNHGDGYHHKKWPGVAIAGGQPAASELNRVGLNLLAREAPAVFAIAKAQAGQVLASAGVKAAAKMVTLATASIGRFEAAGANVNLAACTKILEFLQVLQGRSVSIGQKNQTTNVDARSLSVHNAPLSHSATQAMEQQMQELEHLRARLHSEGMAREQQEDELSRELAELAIDAAVLDVKDAPPPTETP